MQPTMWHRSPSNHSQEPPAYNILRHISFNVLQNSSLWPPLRLLKCVGFYSPTATSVNFARCCLSCLREAVTCPQSQRGLSRTRNKMHWVASERKLDWKWGYLLKANGMKRASVIGFLFPKCIKSIFSVH